MIMWKKIPSLNGAYEASDSGQIRNTETQSVIYVGHNAKGYPVVAPYVGGRRLRLSVHRLVAEAFIGPSELQVNHKDGNKQNNTPSNLEYVTQSENQKHSFEHLNPMQNKGERNPRAKLNTVDVKEIREIYANKWFSHREIARMYGVGATTVFHILKGENWSVVS